VAGRRVLRGAQSVARLNAVTAAGGRKWRDAREPSARLNELVFSRLLFDLVSRKKIRSRADRPRSWARVARPGVCTKKIEFIFEILVIIY
jgi:hypothetical protein